jgi:hypothetical protein
MSKIDKLRKEALDQLTVVSTMNKFTHLFYKEDEFIAICGLFLDAMADRMIQLGKDEGIPKQDIAKMSESLIKEVTKLVKTYTNVDLDSFDDSYSNHNQHNT